MASAFSPLFLFETETLCSLILLHAHGVVIDYIYIPCRDRAGETRNNIDTFAHSDGTIVF